VVSCVPRGSHHKICLYFLHWRIRFVFTYSNTLSIAKKRYLCHSIWCRKIISVSAKWIWHRTKIEYKQNIQQLWWRNDTRQWDTARLWISIIVEEWYIRMKLFLIWQMIHLQFRNNVFIPCKFAVIFKV
jgi:hypothetical protein